MNYITPSEKLERLEMVSAIDKMVMTFGSTYQKDVYRFCYVASADRGEFFRIARNERLFNDLVRWFSIEFLIAGQKKYRVLLIGAYEEPRIYVEHLLWKEAYDLCESQNWTMDRGFIYEMKIEEE